MKHISKVKIGLKDMKNATLRARGIAPRPDYVIKPAAGSLIGDVPGLRGNKERTNAVVERMLASSGVRRRSTAE
ncbi:hypothetical protein QF031_000935 [Pseudarthrobacter defluvii]|uniref:hypothetical protein n=1 Tax=Pseudarthrobacter defluvii TaxID=410837 RepID=UPI00278903E8|nr:hypothetical protein [Pseudarthrobacter defluvii]MDQ0768186.1 hypothetical protein [Pseudarthrobacter defluvii]